MTTGMHTSGTAPTPARRGMLGRLFRGVAFAGAVGLGGTVLLGSEGADALMNRVGLGNLSDYPAIEGVIEAADGLNENVTNTLRNIGVPEEIAQYGLAGTSALGAVWTATGFGNPLNLFRSRDRRENRRIYNEAHNYAVEFGRQVRRDSRRGLFSGFSPRATEQNVAQDIRAKIQDLDQKADLITNLLNNGFSRNGPYVDPAEIPRLLEMDNATLSQETFGPDSERLTVEQMAEIRSVRSAMGDFTEANLDYDEFARLSETEIDAIIDSTPQEAMRSSRLWTVPALVAGAAVFDQTVLDGWITGGLFQSDGIVGNTISSITGFFGDAAGAGMNGLVSGASNLLGGGAAVSQTVQAWLPIVAGLTGIGVMGSLGRAHSGGIGSVAAMLATSGFMWAAVENSDLPNQLENNWWTSDTVRVINGEGPSQFVLN